MSTTKSLWFSPDGTKLAWIQFNDTNVDLMPLTTYDEPGSFESQYPTVTQIRCAWFAYLQVITLVVHLDTQTT